MLNKYSIVYTEKPTSVFVRVFVNNCFVHHTQDIPKKDLGDKSNHKEWQTMLKLQTEELCRIKKPCRCVGIIRM